MALDAEKLKQNVEEVKAEQYEDLQELFTEGEITEDELEAEMDDLFDSGDDFLDVEQGEGLDLSGEASYQIRNIGQLVAFFGGAGLFIYLVLMTKGAAVLPLTIVTLIGAMVYYLWRE